MSDNIEVFSIMLYPTDVKITIVVVVNDGENILIVRKSGDPSVLGGRMIFPGADLREGEDYTDMPEIAQHIIRQDLGLEIEKGKIFGAVANPPRLVEDPETKKKKVEFVLTVCVEAKLISSLESSDIEVLKRWQEARWVPLATFFGREFDAARPWLPQTLIDYLCWLNEKLFDANQGRVS